MKTMGFGESSINAHLVEKQLKLWNAQCRAFNEKIVDEPAFHFLTVAEDEGSLGNEITAELSLRLGWHIFDEEIIHYIAQNSHVSRYYYHDYDDVQFYDVIYNTDRTPVVRIVSSILGFVNPPAEAKSSLI
jgi:hypothetical protein